LLGSPNTINSKLHAQLFSKHDVITLTPIGRSKTSSIIHGVIAGKKNQQFLLAGQIEELTSMGAETVILGCTELSVINHSFPLEHVIDPLDIICQKIMGHKV